jgi:hypothetical protein
MNEKINGLWDKAVTLVEQEPDGDWSLDTIKDKFAELIVAECAEQIIETGTDWVDFAPSQTGVRSEYWAMAQQIKKHFGVKE